MASRNRTELVDAVTRRIITTDSLIPHASKVVGVILDAALPEIAAIVRDMEDLSKDEPNMVDKMDAAAVITQYLGA
jgi:hypothetical protein